jgi:hypothetical protein
VRSSSPASRSDLRNRPISSVPPLRSAPYENSALVSNGWAQGQGVGRQVRALQAATADGVSLYVRPEPGNTAEVSLIAQSLERLRQLSGPGGLLILDSACGHPKTLCEIARADLQFIVLRAQTGFRDRFITDVGHAGLSAVRYSSQREQKLPPEQRTRYRGALRDWKLTDPETGEARRFRVAYIHSSEEHRETAAARERALTKAEEQLQRVKNGLGGRYYKTRTQVEKRVARIIAPNIEGLISTTTSTRNAKPTLTFKRDHDAIAAAAQTDGIYALATNLPQKRLRAGEVLRDYKGQQIVERRHRDYKQTLKVRPIFLHNDDRIYALTSIIGIALLIFGLIETELRKQLHDNELLPGLLPENRAAKPTGRNVLGAFQGLGLTYTPTGIELDRLTYTPTGIELDRLTHTQRRVLELLDITPPVSDPSPASCRQAPAGLGQPRQESSKLAFCLHARPEPRSAQSAGRQSSPSARPRPEAAACLPVPEAATRRHSRRRATLGMALCLRLPRRQLSLSSVVLDPYGEGRGTPTGQPTRSWKAAHQKGRRRWTDTSTSSPRRKQRPCSSRRAGTSGTAATGRSGAGLPTHSSSPRCQD